MKTSTPLRPLLLWVALPVLFHLLWWGLSVVVGGMLLPPPKSVYQSAGELVRTGLFWMHLLSTLYRLFGALFLSCGVALVISLSSYFLSPKGKTVVQGLLNFTYPIPKMLFLPIIIVLAGLGDASKILLVFLVLLLQLTVALTDALKELPRPYLQVMQVLHARPAEMIRHLLLPYLSPTLFSALKVAVGTGISVLFIAETYGTDRGLGYLISDYWMRLQYPHMYATILILGLLGFVLFVLLDLLGKRVWRK